MDVLINILKSIVNDIELSTSLRIINIYSFDDRFIEDIRIPYNLSTKEAIDRYLINKEVENSNFLYQGVKEFEKVPTIKFFTQGKIICKQFNYRIMLSINRRHDMIH